MTDIITTDRPTKLDSSFHPSCFPDTIAYNAARYIICYEFNVRTDDCFTGQDR